MQFIRITQMSIIYFFIAIGYFIMAPKDSHKKPMRNRKKRFVLKITKLMQLCYNNCVKFVLGVICCNKATMKSDI